MGRRKYESQLGEASMPAGICPTKPKPKGMFLTFSLSSPRETEQGIGMSVHSDVPPYTPGYAHHSDVHSLSIPRDIAITVSCHVGTL